MARTQFFARKVVGERAQIVSIGCDVQGADSTDDLPHPPDSGNDATEDVTEMVNVEENINCDPWCSGCSNGGRLVDCSFCLVRSACDVCIPFPDPTTLNESKFLCPICHLERRPDEPYFAFWRNDLPLAGQPTEIAAIERRGWFMRSDSTPFAIISLRLASMSDKGFPPRAVSNHIASYYDDDRHPQRAFEFFDFPFSLATRTAMKDFKSSMVALARHLKQHRFQRILVFVSTHSDPERGDLHHCKGFACAAHELFDCLFPSVLRKYLQIQNSIFVLLACGATVTHKHSFDDILGLATSGTFQATIGFSAGHFQPPRASCFLMKFTENYFFRHYAFDPALKASLLEETGLGAHGNVIVIAKDKRGQWTERHYIWSHIGLRPWGTEVSQQCPHCKRLRPWGKPNVIKETRKSADSPTIVKHSVKHTCRSCRYSRIFEKPSSLVYDGVMAECGRGEWHFTRRVLSSSIP